MAEPSFDALTYHVRAMLKDADLDSWTPRKVRERLQGIFKINLKSRKGEILKVCTQVVNDSFSDSDSPSDSDAEKSANGKRPKKKQSPTSKSPKTKSDELKIKIKKEKTSPNKMDSPLKKTPEKKKKSKSFSDSESGSDSDVDGAASDNESNRSKSSSSSDGQIDSDDEMNNGSSYNNNSSQSSYVVNTGPALISQTISSYSSSGATLPKISSTVDSRSSRDDSDSNSNSDSDFSSQKALDDEELARRLQEQENKRGARSTRFGGSSANGKSKGKSKSKTVKRSKKDTYDDSDGEGAGGGSSSNRKKWNPLPLSPEMAEFTGQSEMTRHNVVKFIYDYCKENNLQDPKNKQFSICDDALYKLIGVKRFRMFGMIKLLTKHFLRDS